MNQEILVVADDEEISNRVLRELRNFGFHATTNTEDAPALIVFDSQVRKVDSAVPIIMRNLKRAFPMTTTPVVIIGSVDDPAARNNLGGTGKKSVLRRPLNTEQLVAEVGRHIRAEAVAL